ncbi:MAG: ATP-binding protein [Candidatus Aminicenantes bacterium]|nr:ATP-binding protein [Candidatus Aminicenantes bacterium]
MKKLPIGIQTFSSLIEENYLYIDKTKNIYKLFAEGGKYYFLSRPRRFGKSLLISTLKEIFSGNKELFKDLWLYDKIQWAKHPVIHLDFLGMEYGSRAELIKSLEFMVNQNAQNYGIKLKEKGYDKKFNELIRQLAKKEKVVILIDEYDKPIINHIDKPEIAMENRNTLRTFYETIKGADEFLEFVFITGVSKFSKVSLFSGLNNLDDITIDETYSTMLGYTQEELLHYFKDRLDALAQEGEKEQWLQDIKTWYNGYSWDGKNFVYNPYSVLLFFQKRRFGNYWFETGTTTFLIKAIKKYHVDVTQLEHYKAGEAIFESFDIERMNVASLLFQTGYLTIREVELIDRTRRLYILSYPNQEVKESLLEHILGEFSACFANDISVIVHELKKTLNEDKIDKFFEILKSLFAKIPYDMFIKEREGYYQTVIYLLLVLIGIDINTEVETNTGRLDAVIETAAYIYIMEFKMGTAESALKQIRDKKYYQPYLTSGKPVKLIGVGFDREERNIKDFVLHRQSK